MLMVRMRIALRGMIMTNAMEAKMPCAERTSSKFEGGFGIVQSVVRAGRNQYMLCWKMEACEL